MKINLSKIHKRQGANAEAIAGDRYLKGVKIDSLYGAAMVWKTETGAAVTLGDHVVEFDESIVRILLETATQGKTSKKDASQ